MKRNLKITTDSFEIVQYYNPYIKIALQKNKLSYFDQLRAICHWHDDIEIIYIISGTMKFYVNGKIYLLNPNDILIINSKQLHYGFSNDGKDCDFICLLIHPQIFSSNKVFFTKYISSITDNYALETLFLSASLQETYINIKNILEEMSILYDSNNNTKEILYYFHIYKIWHNIYNLGKEKNYLFQPTPSEESVLQKKMTSFIYQNYMNKLTLDNIAQSGNICRSKCCKSFKKFFNLSPIEFLNNYRIEYSKALLINSNNSITDIAIQCGFNSLSYFSKLFIRITNQTPREFRNKNKVEEG